VWLVLGVTLLPVGLFLLGGLQGHLIGPFIAAGFVGLATGASGFCLLYILLGISTVKRKQDAS
jgi:hypothetical protein